MFRCYKCTSAGDCSPAGKCLKQSSPWHMICMSYLSIKDACFQEFFYYSRWQHCHLGHTTCSTFRNYSLCLLAWKWFCYWKDCNKVSAYAKLFSTVLQKNVFSHGKLPRSFGQQPKFLSPGLKKIFMLIFCWTQSQPRFISNGSYAWWSHILVFNLISCE